MRYVLCLKDCIISTGNEDTSIESLN